MPLVLVIDDDVAMRQTIRRLLEAAQHEVIEAENGAAGLAQFRARAPDVVITDILMPDMDGLETVRAILGADPRARILAVSGGQFSQAMNALGVAQKFGAAEVLAKPFQREELLAAVDRLLSRA